MEAYLQSGLRSKADVSDFGYMAMSRYDKAFHRWRRDYLIRLLIESAGNRSRAAETIGVHRNTLQRMMREDRISEHNIRIIRDGILEQNVTKTTIPYPTQEIYRTKQENRA